MNRLKKFDAVVLAVALSGAAAMAQVGYPPAGQSLAFSGQGKEPTTNASYFVTSANYWPARIDVINVSGGAPLANLKFYSAGSAMEVSTALAAGLTNILITSAAHIGTLVAGDMICIQSVSSDPTDDLYQVAQVHLTNSTGIILTNTFSGTLTATCPTDFALVSGDKVWKLTEAGSLGIGIATNHLHASGSPLFNFQEGRPGVVLLTVASGGQTNTHGINFISGTYYKKPIY